jgi:hypothetical protein
MTIWGLCAPVNGWMGDSRGFARSPSRNGDNVNGYCVVPLHGRPHAVVIANVEQKALTLRGLGVIAFPIIAADQLADWESADLARPEGLRCRLVRLNPPGAPCDKSVIDEAEPSGRDDPAQPLLRAPSSFRRSGF